MNKTLLIPSEAMQYIKLQRTGYLKQERGQLVKKLRRVPTVKKVLEWKDDQTVRGCFRREILEDYDSIAGHLPMDCQTIVDIGSGVAGLDVLLYRHYLPKQVNVILVDKTRLDEDVYYGFQQRGAFYNSLEIARQLLQRNNVPTEKIVLHEVGEENILNISKPVDLVVSILSWGFHYPVETYLEQVHALLKDEGRLILDVRKGTNGLEQLGHLFEFAEIKMKDKKYTRVCAKKK